MSNKNKRKNSFSDESWEAEAFTSYQVSVAEVTLKNDNSPSNFMDDKTVVDANDRGTQTKTRCIINTGFDIGNCYDHSNGNGNSTSLNESKLKSQVRSDVCHVDVRFSSFSNSLQSSDTSF